MKVLRTIQEVRQERKHHVSVAFVPTMGALHDGHLALIRKGKEIADSVFVSIFVNPLQFGLNEDFAIYPRDEFGDLEKAEAAGADVVFLPSAIEMYNGGGTLVHVTGVSDLFEGQHRPGHFDGVATVVLKLFNIVWPDIALFGLKDLQQCAVVQALTADLDYSVKLQFVETIRDVNGLALSSRNVKFSIEQRVEASILYQTIKGLASRIVCDPTKIDSLIDSTIQSLQASGFDVEYLDCVSQKTMYPVRDSLDEARLIIAARFCDIRLIDNVVIVL